MIWIEVKNGGDKMNKSERMEREKDKATIKRLKKEKENETYKQLYKKKAVKKMKKAAKVS